MSRILELYAKLLEQSKAGDGTERFINDTFVTEEYNSVFPQLTIIDAGAYQGDFSFACLPFAKIIYAFEPDPRPFKVFKSTVDKFGFKKKIKYSNEALAATTEERVLLATGFGGSRLMAGGEAANESDKTLVSTISLVDVFNKHKIKQVDIFKIDIEGGEDEIIRSREFPELSKKIKVIIGEHLAPVDGLLKELGYSAKVINNNTLYERQS